jgi:glycosyltransferase involved in cell wall biosynthesis
MTIRVGFGTTPVKRGRATARRAFAKTYALRSDYFLVVDPRSVQELRDAMQKLVSDTALASELRRRGAERARRMSWGECARRTLEVYRKVLA